MSALSDLRTGLATALEGADFHAFATLPEDVDPPLVCVAPGDPYVNFEGDAGLNFGEAKVRHQLLLVVERGDNDVETDALDSMILAVLAIDFGDHQVEEVGEPGPVLINKQVHLGVNIRLSIPIRL